MANLSLGGPDSSQGSCQNDSFHRSFCQVVSAGVTVVVAAGNESDDARWYTPAAYDEVITVSALADANGQPGGGGGQTGWGPDDSLAGFSNYGADVDIAAPALIIQSTVPGGYEGGWDGTSMASPHVAGAAALYKATQPNATPGQVKAALQSTRETISLPNDPDTFDEGVLDETVIIFTSDNGSAAPSILTRHLSRIRNPIQIRNRPATTSPTRPSSGRRRLATTRSTLPAAVRSRCARPPAMMSGSIGLNSGSTTGLPKVGC